MTVKTLRRQLAAAIAMTLVSTVALGSSTYAWFTMSREVEVKNIKLVATVPEDLQISLGQLSTTANSQDGYANNKGILVGSTSPDNGGVNAPRDLAEDWANTVDVSNYYAMGKIIPASSTNGLNVYFTPDAAGVGKTIKAGAKYYKAVEGATIANDANTTPSPYMTTLHAYTTEGGDTWVSGSGSDAYTKAVTWNDVKDDGYFVDIPVWIRSSSKEAIGLYVDAYVTTNIENDDDDLYLAARAVILNDAKSTTSNLIEIKEGSYAGTESIVDFMSSTNPTGAAVSGEGTNNAGTYGAEAYYDGSEATGTAAVTVPAAGADVSYGTPVKIWVRVWLEGEDQNCWNQNAGQDFNISLKFSKEPITLPTETHHFTAAATDTTDSLVDGTPMTINFGTTPLVYTYSYSATSWQLTSGTFPAPAEGKVWKISDTVIADEAALEAYLNTNVKTAAQAATAPTVTEATP
jgi:hypothetical protein